MVVLFAAFSTCYLLLISAVWKPVVSFAWNAKEAARISDKCISCEWLSPESARALFLIDAFLGMTPEGYNSETLKTLRERNFGGKSLALYWNASLKDKSKAKVLDEIFDFIIDITQAQCDTRGDWSSPLISIEARVLEGENPARKNEIGPYGLPYHTKSLTNILEDQHLRLIDSCRLLAYDIATGIEDNSLLRETRDTFVQFSEFLKEKFLEASERNLVLLAEISDRDEDDDSKVNLLQRGKKLIAWDYLFKSIKSKAADFFVKQGSGLNCAESIEKYLVEKHRQTYAQLARVFEPMKKLLAFKPDDFVQIPPEERKGRKIFGAAKDHEEMLEKYEPLAELSELYSFMKATMKRKDQLCG